MSVEGKIVITLSCGNNNNNVSIGSSRPVHASQLFHGKPVAETLKLLPLLFNICGTAQACAAVRACEEALGVRADVAIDRQRENLVAMESIKEHLWRILHDWSAFNGATPEQESMAEMLTIQKDYREALCNGSDPFQLDVSAEHRNPEITEKVLKRLLSLLERTVYGMEPQQWLEHEKLEDIEAWATSHPGHATKVIQQVMKADWNEAGRCDAEHLPELENDQLFRFMENPHFIEQPEWQGHCCETSSLTRTRSALLDELAARYGNGLLVRVIARLIELAQLAVSLETVPNSVDEQRITSEIKLTNSGIGEVEAARGRLLHRVEVENGNISSYRILAPTEWNFHPRGVVAQSLTTLQGSRDKVEQQARLLINTIDPCVGYELSTLTR